MIRKITGKNNNTPTKHLTHNNLKITDNKDIANHLTKNFLLNSSAKNQSKSFQIIKTKAEKVKIKFQRKNTESYNQPFSIAELKESLNKAHNTVVGPDKIHYQFLNHPQISSYKSSTIYGTEVTYLKYGKKLQLYQYPNLSKTIQMKKVTDPFLLAVVSAKH